MWSSVAFGNALPHTDIDVFLFSSSDLCLQRGMLEGKMGHFLV